MQEQIIVWRDDFENIPLEERFVEKWGEYETIYTSSCAALIEIRGNFNLRCFIMFEGRLFSDLIVE